MCDRVTSKMLSDDGTVDTSNEIEVMTTPAKSVTLRKSQVPTQRRRVFIKVTDIDPQIPGGLKCNEFVKPLALMARIGISMPVANESARTAKFESVALNTKARFAWEGTKWSDI